MRIFRNGPPVSRRKVLLRMDSFCDILVDTWSLAYACDVSRASSFSVAREYIPSLAPQLGSYKPANLWSSRSGRKQRAESLDISNLHRRTRACARSHTRSDSERPTGTAPTPRWLKAPRMRYSSESVAGGSGTAGLTTSPASLLDADRKLSGGIRLPTFAPALRRRAQVPLTERVSRNHRGRVEGRGGIETKSVMSGTECGRLIR
jgi:hypothetical protein